MQLRTSIYLNGLIHNRIAVSMSDSIEHKRDRFLLVCEAISIGKTVHVLNFIVMISPDKTLINYVRKEYVICKETIIVIMKATCSQIWQEIFISSVVDFYECEIFARLHRTLHEL